MSDIRTFAEMQKDIEILKTNEIPWYSTGTWTPSFTGFSVDPANGLYRYVRIGMTVTLFVKMPNAGTSNGTGFTVSFPFTAKVVTNMIWYSSTVRCTDAGVFLLPQGLALIASGATIVNLYTTNGGGGWTASLGKMADFTISFEIG